MLLEATFNFCQIKKTESGIKNCLSRELTLCTLGLFGFGD